MFKIVLLLHFDFLFIMQRENSSTIKLPASYNTKIFSGGTPEKGFFVKDSPRLVFPAKGDSSIFTNVGRMHFQNNSQELLKIILPDKYAQDSPINMKRMKSLPPPHLQRNFNDFSHDYSPQSPNSAQIKTNDNSKSKDNTVTIAIQDELDRMKAEY